MLAFRQQPFRQLAKDIFRGHPVFALQGAFPDDTTSPSGAPERRLRPCINCAIARDLRFPEFLPSFGPFEEMTIVAVPETPMREQDGMTARKYHVGFAG